MFAIAITCESALDNFDIVYLVLKNIHTVVTVIALDISMFLKTLSTSNFLLFRQLVFLFRIIFPQILWYLHQYWQDCFHRDCFFFQTTRFQNYCMLRIAKTGSLRCCPYTLKWDGSPILVMNSWTLRRWILWKYSIRIQLCRKFCIAMNSRKPHQLIFPDSIWCWVHLSKT